MQHEPESPRSLARNDVAKVARLALLDLADSELDRFTPQLAAVLDRAADLEQINTEGVPPTPHPYTLNNVFRPDVVEDFSDIRDEVMAAAPASEDGMFMVPPALGEEP